jgi:hypothetical protein
MTSAVVPDRLLPHTVTVVAPAVSTDSYGDKEYDYGAAATRTAVKAWLQQDQRTQVTVVGADPLQSRWLMVTNHSPIARRSRIEWADSPEGPLVFEIDGPANPSYNPLAMAAAGTNGPHHTELSLKIVDG